jgi:aspartate carbamoyltransferase catalytic subunit
LVPFDFESLGVRVSHSFADAVKGARVVYLLRIQHERMDGAFLPSLSEYRETFGMDADRLATLPADTFIMHPGPVNRGVEVTREVMHSPQSRILGQVTNGVAVRMGVLALLEEARTRGEAAL